MRRSERLGVVRRRLTRAAASDASLAAASFAASLASTSASSFALRSVARSALSVSIWAFASSSFARKSALAASSFFASSSPAGSAPKESDFAGSASLSSEVRARLAAASSPGRAGFFALCLPADLESAARFFPGVFFALLGSAGGGVMGLHPSSPRVLKT